MTDVIKVIIPRTENTIKCRLDRPSRTDRSAHSFADINSELDELDREEFFRLKKVKSNKERASAAANAEAAKKRRQGGDKENETGLGQRDVLGEEDDEDVIF